MDKRTLKYDEILAIVRQEIKTLYNVDIQDEAISLFQAPYFFKSYDIIYIIVHVFKQIGYLNKQFSQEKVENASFHSLASIATFIYNI